MTFNAWTADIRWLDQIGADECRSIHSLIGEVVGAGGAVGWYTTPRPDEIDAWLEPILKRTDDGDARLAVVNSGNEVIGIGAWIRGRSQVTRHLGEIQKLMVHPSRQHQGIGAALLEAIIRDARSRGLELLTLGTRGNNQNAIGLYRRFGFQEWGRLPGGIAAGSERFDDLRMHLRLRPGSQLSGYV